MHVNLLPSSFVWRQLFRKRLRQWACAFGVLLIAFIGSNARLLAQWWFDHREYQTMHRAADPVRKLNDTRIEVAKKNYSLTKKIQALQALTLQDRSTSLLGLIAQSVNATSETIQIQELQVNIAKTSNEQSAASAPSASVNPSPAKPASTNQPIENQYRVTIKGIATESESISKFIESIQSSKVFPKVELRSTQERVVMDRSIQDFQLECSGNE